MSKAFIKWTGGLKKIDQVKAHAKYVGFRSQEIEGNKGFFSKDSDNYDYKKFIEGIKDNKALSHEMSVKAHKVLFSLKEVDYEAYKRSGKDYKNLVRDTLKQYEEKNGVTLDWIANIHESKGHPHCHVIIKGVSDKANSERKYKRIYFSKDSFKEMKEIFDKEVSINAEYKWHENVETDKIFKEMQYGFENLLVSQHKERIENLVIKDLSDSVQISRAIKHYDYDIDKAIENPDCLFAPQLLKLSEKLNDYKKTYLNQIPDEYKKEIYEIAKDIINQNHYDTLLNDYLTSLDSTEEFKEEGYQNIVNIAAEKVFDSIKEIDYKVYYKINDDKLHKAINKINDLSNPIDTNIEKQNLLNRMAFTLYTINPNIDIRESLEKINGNTNNNLNLTEKNIIDSLKYVESNKDNPREVKYINGLSDNKKIYLFSNTLKACGLDNNQTSRHIVNYFKRNITIEKEMDNLVEKGYVSFKNGTYELTKDGVNEFLNIKTLNGFENKIISALKEKEGLVLDELLDSSKVYKAAEYIYKNDNLYTFNFSKYDANVIGEYFKSGGLKVEGKELENNKFTLDKLKEKIYSLHEDEDVADKQYKMISGRIDKLVNTGYIDKLEDDSFILTQKFEEEKERVNKVFVFTKYDSNVIFNYIQRAGGELNSNTLLKLLNKDYEDSKYIEGQHNYILRRIQKNIKSGYIRTNDNGNFVITNKGITEERKVKYPAGEILKDKLDYLNKLGILEYKDDKYYLNEKIYDDLGTNKSSDVFKKEIYNLLNKNNGSFSYEKFIEKINDKTINISKNIKLDKDYSDFKKEFKVSDIKEKTIKNISKVMFMSEMSRYEVKEKIFNWLNNNNENYDREKIEKIIDDAEVKVKQGMTWGRPDVINKDDWKEMFASIGIESPEWIYDNNYDRNKGIENTIAKSFESFLNSFKNEIKKEEAKAEHEKNKIKKNKDRSDKDKEKGRDR